MKRHVKVCLVLGFILAMLILPVCAAAQQSAAVQSVTCESNDGKRNYSFTGDYFCMRRGESRDSLGSYGGTISSIRVFGYARVIVFNDRNFRNGSDGTSSDVPDLRQWKMTSKPPHTWNNRISSLQVQ